MESFLKKELKLSEVKQFGSGGGGCISQGQGYETDQGKIFVKFNSEKGARGMFEGEAASLKALRATNTVRVPKPLKVLDDPNGSFMLVTEYLDMKSLRKYSGQLGEDMARLHLHNEEVVKTAAKQDSSVHYQNNAVYVDKFGFHIATCCGKIPQDNSWQEDWVVFYMRQKLQLQLDLVEKDYGDREAQTLWAELMPKVPSFFKGLEIKPSLLHGDLWGGNAAELDDRPTVFDPASFYGHHEFDLAIAMMFSGFSQTFFERYFSVIPKAPGFAVRNKLYQLFHYLNHWNHFGTGYRGSSIGIMKELLKASH